MAEKFHRADLKSFEFFRRAKQAVFAEWFAAGQFQIRPKTATNTFEGKLRKPALDRAQAGLAHDGGPECCVIIGKSLLRFELQHNREIKEFAKPFADGTRIVQRKLYRGTVSIPQAYFGNFGVELATQLMDPRCAFAIYDFPFRIINRVNAVVFQNAATGDAGCFDRNAVQGFDGKYGDSPELH